MKSASQIALDKTAPEVAAPAPKIPANATPDTLNAEAERVRAAADAKLVEIKRQLAHVNSIRAPLGALLLQRQTALEQIANGERHLRIQQDRARAYSEKMRQCFATDEGTALFWQVASNDPALPIAERLVAELEAWLAERRAEAPGLTASCREYAARHGLQYLLPADM